jgi:hypothetical protein
MTWPKYHFRTYQDDEAKLAAVYTAAKAFEAKYFSDNPIRSSAENVRAGFINGLEIRSDKYALSGRWNVIKKQVLDAFDA